MLLLAAVSAAAAIRAAVHALTPDSAPDTGVRRRSSRPSREAIREKLSRLTPAGAPAQHESGDLPHAPQSGSMRFRRLSLDEVS